MRKIFFYGVLAAFLWLAQVSAATAATIGFSPDGPYNITGGGSLSVDVSVSGLAGQIVSAYDLDILYDPSFLNPTAVTLSGVGLSSFSPDGIYDVQLFPGLIDAAAVSFMSDADLLALQGGSGFKLFTIDFSTLKDGETSLAFDWGPGQDVKGLENGVIIGGAVPEPGTLFLVGAGLVALVGLRKCKVTV